MLVKSKFAKITDCKADGKQVNIYAKACKGCEEFLFKEFAYNEAEAKHMENDCPKGQYIIAEYVDERCSSTDNGCLSFRIEEAKGMDYYIKELC